MLKTLGFSHRLCDKLRKMCGGKNHSNYKKRLKESTKQKIADAHRKSNLTYEQIVNYRKGAVKRIERQKLLSGGKIGRNYNPIACNFFNKLNSYKGWNGKHALNGGEYAVYELGYFLDYYDTKENVVIEWDEPYHRKKKQMEKDELKQKEVVELLKCKFYRIKQYEMDFDLLQKLKNGQEYNIKEVVDI